MTKTKELLSVKLSRESLQELEALKIHHRQPLYEVVDELIRKNKEVMKNDNESEDLLEQ